MCEDQCIFFCREIEDPSLASRGLLAEHVKNRGPVRILEVKRLEHSVGDVQQALALRSYGQRNMSRRVSGRGDGTNAGHDLGSIPYEGQPILERPKEGSGGRRRP